MKKVLFLFLFLTTLLLSCNGNKKYGCEGTLYQGKIFFEPKANRVMITSVLNEYGGVLAIDSIAPTVSDTKLLDCKCTKQVCFDYIATDSFLIIDPLLDTLDNVYRKIILTQLFETEY